MIKCFFNSYERILTTRKGDLDIYMKGVDLTYTVVTLGDGADEYTKQHSQ